MSDANEAITIVRRRLAGMKDVRRTWDPHWLDLSDYILPFNGRGLTGDDESRENNGSKRHSKIIDGTATYAINVFNAGMQSGVTSPARPWFKMGLADRELAEFGPVKDWLFIVQTELYKTFGRSNFYNSVHALYNELGCFGTGALAVYESFKYGIRCRPFTIGEYYMAVDANLRVDTFYHNYWMTVNQMIQEFGQDRVSKSVKQLYESNSTEKLIQCTRAIEPSDSRITLPGAEDFPYRSMHFETKGSVDDGFLQVGGFDDFPIMAPRWDVVGRDVYGTSPGMHLLGDIKMLQIMQEKSLMAINKQVDPPLKAPGTMESQMVNSMPGGISYSSETNGSEGLGALYQVNLDVNAVEAKIANVQLAIRRGYYNDLFMMISQNTSAGKRMTATEVAERHEEKLLMLGPAMERLHSELLDPAIGRTFNILLANGKIPPPPPEVQGQSIEVEYISVLAQAQKMVGLSSIDRLMGYVGTWAQLFPEMKHKVDAMSTVDDYADALGTPPSVVISTAEALESWNQEQQAMAMQNNMAMGGQAADAAKTLSETDTSGEDNLLSQVTGG